ncbi:MAG: T9SS type B sorting domain-containing protein [Cyclobacteriaceae bacterium]|nr:T9SS type B sorting domain-containing protein [Cyclobacteriaceae bacterium]
MKKFTFVIVTVWLMCPLACISIAQVPDIVKVDKVSGTFGALVTISGSGFSNAATDMSVHFGAAKGQILSSTEYVMEVLAPSGATYANISVTNTKSMSTGYAKSYFNLAYKGEVFEASRITESLRIKEDVELFDLCNCDFNGDGLVDVATTNNSDDAGGSSITVYQNLTKVNSADIQLQAINEINLNTGKAARNVVCGDLDGDGKPELVVGKGGGNADRLYVFKNTSTAVAIKFNPFITVLLSENVSSSTTRRLKIHDLDKDGKPDIIMTDQGKGNIFVFGNKSTNGALNFPASARQSIQTSAGSLVGLDVADLNDDNKPEIVCNSSTSEVFILTNQSIAGEIKFGTPDKKTITGSNLVNLRIADFDNDGDKDVVLTNYVSNIFILKNAGTSSSYIFGAPIFIETGRLPWGLSLGDLNGDGLTDIVVTTTVVDEPLSVLINKSTATNISFTQKLVGEIDKSFNVNIADFNGDAKPDIAYIESDKEELIFMRNTNCIISAIRPVNPPKICSGKPVRLITTPAPKVEYAWINSATNQTISTTFNADITTAGTYKVSIKSVFDGCESISEAVTLLDGGNNLPPSVDIASPGPVCQGGTFKLAAKLISGVNYVWTTPRNTVLNGNEITISNAQIEDAGRYTLTLVSSGCSTDPKAEVVQVSTIPPMEISTSEGELFCEGSTNTLSVPFVSGATYTWKYNEAVIPGATGATYSPAKTGTYSVSLLDKNLCSANSETISVKSVQQPEASFKDVASSCLNEEIVFANTSTFDASVEPIFNWDFGDATASTAKNPSHTYEKAGTYKVTLKVGYANTTCSSVYEYSVKVGAFMALEIKANGKSVENGVFNLCAGTKAELAVNAQPGQIEWNTGETTPKIMIASPGTYTVIFGKNTGCASQDEIEVKEVENVSLTVASSQRIESGGSAQLSADGAETYLWQPEEFLDNPKIANPLATPVETTEFNVIGSNAFGCADTATVKVFVDEKVTITVDAPKTFTPNGDGINDVWIIKNLDVYQSCPIQIFNRRGQHVYDANEYHNDWDGFFNGKELPEGAYYYILSCGASEVHTGDITLLR